MISTSPRTGDRASEPHGSDDARNRNRDGSTPLILAHRGFSLDGHENTQAAFEAAWELGCRWMETDVNTTRDGVVMVFHDTTLDRMTDGSGAVSDHTHAELSEYSVAGADALPTFAQLLEALPEARFNVDLKDEASVAALPELLERLDAVDRVRIASFSESRRRRCLEEMRARGLAAPSSSAGVASCAVFVAVMQTVPAAWPLLRRLLSRWCAPFDLIQMPLHAGGISVRAARAPGLGPLLERVRLVGPRLVRRAHAAGVQVHVWTVDEPADMRDLLRAGCDGIVTNRADLGLREVRSGDR